MFRCKEALEGGLHVLDGFVDHTVRANVDLLSVDRTPGLGVRAHVECYDDRVRGLREHHVALRHRADTAVNDFYPHFLGGEVGEGICQRFGGAALVGFDDDAECLDLTSFELSRQVFQTHAARGTPKRRFPMKSLPLLCDLTRFGRVSNDVQRISGDRYLVEPDHLHGYGRASRFDGSAAFVEHSTHAPR